MILHTLEYLSFAQRDPAGVKTVLAQFFSLDSEGFVFKGKKALIDETNAPHISKNEAEMHALYSCKNRHVRALSSASLGNLPARPRSRLWDT